MQPLLAIARLTWKSAFRYRLFWVLFAALIGAVALLPLLLKDDGTARGFVQILLTYTLSLAGAVLGVSTLWLSCGSLARDVEECQIQMVAVKPIGRWQIWVGKWLGILALNAALLAVAGAGIYGLLEWRSRSLTPMQRQILRDEVLVSRAAFKPRVPPLDEIIRKRLASLPNLAELTPPQQAEARAKVADMVYGEAQLVLPRNSRFWMFDLGLGATRLGDEPLFIRTRFYAASTNQGSLYTGVWQFSTPESTERADTPPLRLASDAFQEFKIPSRLVDKLGRIVVIYESREDVTLLFPLDDGIEILYRDGGFLLNLIRGLFILLAWLSLLSAVSLAAASITSFPVAAFCSISLLIVIWSSGTLAESVGSETAMGGAPEDFRLVRPVVNAILLPLFKVILAGVNLLDVASPVDMLSSGRAITWWLVGVAWLKVVGVTGGLVAALGIWLLGRRELATAQGGS